ncbi:MAG TPA: hypothetical protein VH209_12650 [Steroidobacteraceae bacterium]|nr:hypothetical protein [Steroidobacteraceae bacterium]
MLAATWVGLGLSVARAEPDDPAPAPPRATLTAAAATPATVTAAAATPATAVAPVAPAAPAAPAAPLASAPGAAGSTTTAATSPSTAPSTSQFASQDRWEHAGYNQDEIVYTVFITNHEPNILRCRTEIHGFYFNNGQKGEISDVQVSTVFPDKQVQAGIWSGLDEAAGATYKVSCRAL